jgi:exodeoxyribonuclease-3
MRVVKRSRTRYPASMRVITLNANGIRAAARKGLYAWLKDVTPDIVCIQEIKAHEEQLTTKDYYPQDFHVIFTSAEKPGYSGTAIYSRQRPHAVQTGVGWPQIDLEGRWTQFDYPGLSVVSLYLPSGSARDDRQVVKYQVMDKLTPMLARMADDDREWIVCGDWNIVHTEKDITNWKANQKNSGCLPEERAWLDRVFGEFGLVDAFRVVDDRDGQYTWWSNRGQAWARNVGWRIDYQVVSPGLRGRVRRAEIYKDQRFSDHAPLIIDYDFELRG